MPRLTLRIDFDDDRHIGHGKIRLLELIGEHGSISRAAKEMNMSYRRAWLLTDAMNKMFKTPAVETQHGGTGGGAARVTSFGRALVAHYRSMEADAAEAFGQRLDELDRELRR
ncbi:MAG: winged helix-turn-helix domain-containing protein [Hyphomicrobiales bacterium]|nr:winged helix-turn-helix domain-containing protein [Hyphomicrobiales bacterium]